MNTTRVKVLIKNITKLLGELKSEIEASHEARTLESVMEENFRGFLVAQAQEMKIKALPFKLVFDYYGRNNAALQGTVREFIVEYPTYGSMLRNFGLGRKMLAFIQKTFEKHGIELQRH